MVGTIIGTGIFLKTAIMTELLGSAAMVLLAWLVAGILSFLGALSYAELGEVYPEAGGEFVYLKESYNELTAFLYGWQRFFISTPGTIAAYAVGAATFLSAAIQLPIVPTAIGFVVIFTLLNCMSVAFGGKVQTFFTAIKIFLIASIVIGIIFFSHTASIDHFKVVAHQSNWSGFGAALLAALWAFDGWNNLSMAAGEIKSPQRNIPLALLIGMFIVLALYAAANLAYFFALPLSEIINSNSATHPQALPVATNAVKTFLGKQGLIFISITFVLSALGAMNGSILTNARIPFAMAKMNLFHQIFARLNKHHVPVVSVLIQGLLSAILAATGTFDQLTDYVVFASWIFYALNAYSVIRSRKKRPNATRKFKVPTIIPYLFSLLAIILLVNCIYTMAKESAFGLILIGLGIPFFIYLKKAQNN